MPHSHRGFDTTIELDSPSNQGLTLSGSRRGPEHSRKPRRADERLRPTPSRHTDDAEFSVAPLKFVVHITLEDPLRCTAMGPRKTYTVSQSSAMPGQWLRDPSDSPSLPL
jgi:hypothetical protein